MKASWDEVTVTATEENFKWSTKNRLAFHYFNPNGLMARKWAANKRIDAAVDAGALKSGAILAYGGLACFHEDQIRKLFNLKRTPDRIPTIVAIRGLQEACEKAEKCAQDAGF